MQIRAFIFDADGVVVHPWRFARYLEREHRITDAQTQEFFRGTFLNCLVGQADLKTELAPFLQKWGWRESVDTFLQRWLIEEDAVNIQLIGAIADLRNQGIRCYLATNQENYRASYMKQIMGFSRLFDGAFFSAEIGAIKPNLDFFEYVTAAIGQPPSSMLFWDDSEKNVQAARKHGWQAEQYTDFETFQMVLPKYI
ncbi:HAD-IA family hydrolase [Kovacikia minuta CCNUW1]|uniref:HAD family hydrolase n=1 Tax=Kovacikia minuta TaxID=2931930 RepID=UPI001CCCBC0C|nr:HAD-IA family hydrolase [Kovacikia minuta]UBF25143.1 HAD-IA family hydrolase [Kovacikia minuta CCNUW1]